MSEQTFDSGADVRILFRGRQNVAGYQRVLPARVAHKVTDRHLIRKAHAANGPLKRAFDCALATALLMFLSPLFIAIAVAVKLSSPGPALYRHTRIGRKGRRFSCLKFRTMRIDSEERLAHILNTDPHAAAEWLEFQKLRDDPRVTPLGAFLRRTSLDELPQFFNVLSGEMSMIGPRPITRDELERYGRDRRYYLLVRPGISGLWQVNGRSNTSYERRVQYDRQYLDDWTWTQEISIALRTVPALFRGSC